MVLSQSLYKVLSGWGNEVHVIAPAWSREVIERMPEVAMSFESPARHGELKLSERTKLAHALRNNHYSRAIVLPRSLKAAYIPWAARIPVRTGYRGEYRYGLINDMRPLDKKSLVRIVDRYVNLAPPVNGVGSKMGNKSRDGRHDDSLAFPAPAPSLTIDAKNIKRLVEENNLDMDKPIIAMMPGAAFGRSKQWPPKYFADVAKNHIRDGAQIWIFGSRNDFVTGEDIAREAGDGVVNLCGQTELVDTVDLLSLADKAVSNDSGLMHIAAAVGCPVVAMYGATSVDYTPPMIKASQSLHNKLPCSPCWKKTCRYGHYRCLTEIKPDKVYDISLGLRRGAS